MPHGVLLVSPGHTELCMSPACPLLDMPVAPSLSPTSGPDCGYHMLSMTVVQCVLAQCMPSTECFLLGAIHQQVTNWNKTRQYYLKCPQ